MYVVPFVNHEIEKIIIPNMFLAAVGVYSLMAAVAVLTIKKTGSAVFLDRDQTGQMKGLAMLLIVAGHINHVIPTGDFPNFANIGVVIFLLCSGYGLTVSTMKSGLSLKGFLLKRLVRLFLPYWVVTIMVISADYALLSKYYSANDMMLTFLGLNLNDATRHLDYARWFVTYILILYMFFMFAVFAGRKWNRVLIVLWVGALLMDAAIYAGEASFAYRYVAFSFAFPLGCTVAVYRESIVPVFEMAGRSNVIGACALIAPFGILGMSYFYPVLFAGVGPRLATFLSMQVYFTVFTVMLFFAMAYMKTIKVVSRFLAAFGDISYEVFLLHGIFLVKYDFLLNGTDFVLRYCVFLAFVLAVSYILNRLVSQRAATVLVKWAY